MNQTPAEWRSRADWASGRIESTHAETAIAQIVFGGLFVVAGVIMLGTIVVRLDVPLAVKAFAVLPALLGAALVRSGVRLRRQLAAHGKPLLALRTVPGEIGFEVGGRIVFPAAADELVGREFRVTLRCVHRVVSGTGKNRSTRDTERWRDEAVLRAARGPEDVAYADWTARVPIDREPTRLTPRDDRILWLLDVHAAGAGGTQLAAFEVPVVRTERTEAALGGESPETFGSELPVAGLAPRRPDDRSGIGVDERNGALTVQVAANRLPRLTRLLAALGIGLLGACVLLLMLDGVPLLLPVVFGVFAALVLVSAAISGLRSARLDVTREGLVFRQTLLGMQHERLVRRAEIASVGTRVNAVMDQRELRQLFVLTPEGRRIALFGGIDGEAEAAWLSEAVQRSLD